MQRRKFIRGGVAGAITLVGGQAALASTPSSSGPEPELIEWRTYEMAFGGNQGLLTTYFDDALAPALRRKGATQFQVYKEYGDPNPVRIHLMIAYAGAQAFYDATDLSDDPEYAVASEAYVNMGAERAVFTRYSTTLLRSFSAMPLSVAPGDGKGLFELRIYESGNEDQLTRKIRMFNEYELDIFDDTGLTPVFFGNMIAGPHRPALMYLLQFDDMADRDDSWGNFSSNDTWNRIKGMEEFAGTVSNIRRTFLVPG